jgi:RNA polymerase sigma-70 factor (ECF subfamily)
MSGAIAEAFTQLSLGELEVLTLRYWADFSYEEIAIAAGIPTGTVKSRLNRARDKMRVHLAFSVVESDDG